MAGNTAEALRRIKKNKLTKSKILDLSGLGLTELPDELWDCMWLEELGLGHRYFWDHEQQQWGYNWSEKKVPNDLTNISERVAELKKLEILTLDGNPLSSLKELKGALNLSKLNLRGVDLKKLDGSAVLPNLSDLYLVSCRGDNLSALHGFKNLKKLDLTNSAVENFSELSSLTNLTHLNLKNTQFKDLNILENATNLINLDLRDSKVSNLMGLRNLINLTHLDLRGIQPFELSEWVEVEHTSEDYSFELPEIYNFERLFRLPSDITEDEFNAPIDTKFSIPNGKRKSFVLKVIEHQPIELEGLSFLKNLISLNLSAVEVADISSLSGLINLTELYLGNTKVKDIKPLAGLVELQYLNLEETNITEIYSLGNLINLVSLNLSKTNIRDLKCLSKLRKLSYLNLSDANIDYFNFDLLTMENIKELNVEKIRCINVPLELTKDEHALAHLKNYHAELIKDPYSAYEAKQIIVGNGRVGKTSLLKVLYNLGDFNAAENSTHGIQLFDTTLPLARMQAQANLSVWDFGGQELYHATHRIFMQTRAIYLVVWDTRTEANLGEEKVNLYGQELVFRNYSLYYWLGNIRSLSENAKIIVVCNKADNGQEIFPDNLKALQEEYDIDSFISVSAKTGYGIATLYQRIQLLLNQMPEMGMQMPGSWRNIKGQLKVIQAQQFIGLEQYYKICKTERLSIESANTLLEYLSLSGFLFQHQNLGEYIILDQKWALEAIYQLLDRNGWYPLLKGNALRRREELAKCWKEYNKQQIDLFLLMMSSCELALKLEDQEQENPTYLIPELLPDNPAPAVKDIWETAVGPTYHLRFQHPFFHASLIQRFIVRTAKLAERYDLLWRTGLLLKVDDTMARIQIFPAQSKIEIQTRGKKCFNLIRATKQEIASIQNVRNQAQFEVSLSGQDNEWVSLEQLELLIKKGKPHIASTTGEVLDLAPFHPLLSTSLPLPDDREGKTPGLKELSDQTTGKQLLVPIAPSSSLEALKNQVKDQLIAANLQAALTLLRDYLQPDTPASNEWIILQSQYTRYEQEIQRGLLDTKEKDLKYNILLTNILNFLNNIQK